MGLAGIGGSGGTDQLMFLKQQREALLKQNGTGSETTPPSGSDGFKNISGATNPFSSASAGNISNQGQSVFNRKTSASAGSNNSTEDSQGVQAQIAQLNLQIQQIEQQQKLSPTGSGSPQPGLSISA